LYGEFQKFVAALPNPEDRKDISKIGEDYKYKIGDFEVNEEERVSW
jgi:hypothetical protein